MNAPGQLLGYDAAPAITTPLRFFFTAPLFGILAGAVLVLHPDLLLSRWTPGALAVTHLVTIGFMLMVMTGALLQILPVVAGATVPWSVLVATLVHPGLSAGALLLAWGLWSGAAAALVWASWLLGGAFLIFLLAAAVSLWRAPVTQASPRDLRLALVGLAMTVLLGMTLALILARGWSLPLLQVLELHIAWGLLGGAGLLLAATSWIVVPMFQITPNYPGAITRGWAPGMLLLLVLWSAAVLAGLRLPAAGLLVAMLLLALVFPATTLMLQARSRRSRPDPVFRAFTLGMLGLAMGGAGLLPLMRLQDDFWPVLYGIVVLHGGFVSVMTGMLHKIVPFLAWLHLTRAGLRAPNLKQLLPETDMRRQLALHLAALVMLVAGAVSGHGGVVIAAGLLVIGEFSLLLHNLVAVARRYGASRRAAIRRPSLL